MYNYGIRRVIFGCKNDRFGGTGGVLNIHSDPATIPPYPVRGNILRQRCITVQREFYLQENTKAPNPSSKKGRKLKTEIAPYNGPETVGDEAEKAEGEKEEATRKKMKDEKKEVMMEGALEVLSETVVWMEGGEKWKKAKDERKEAMMTAAFEVLGETVVWMEGGAEWKKAKDERKEAMMTAALEVLREALERMEGTGMAEDMT
ncbi:MAG: tRNA(adenine34) deaminase [Bathelium mastoideum]|nr:MAG: tRNA(adenine34) deaminase [Bathelium mastoideum]